MAQQGVAQQVMTELESRGPDVQEGKYVAIFPSEALSRVIGEAPEHKRMNALCASFGCNVEIPRQSPVACITIKPHAQAEALLWEVLAPLQPHEACGVGVPVPEAARPRLAEATLQLATRHAPAARAVHATGALLVAGPSAALHVALLLLLRDALGSEHAAGLEAFAGTLYPALVPRLSAALAALAPPTSPAAAAAAAAAASSSAAPRLLPLDGAASLTTAALWTGKASLARAAHAAHGAARGVQLLHLCRLVLHAPPAADDADDALPPAAAAAAAATPALLVASDVDAVASALALRLAGGAVQQATELRAHAMHTPCTPHAHPTHMRAGGRAAARAGGAPTAGRGRGGGAARGDRLAPAGPVVRGRRCRRGRNGAAGEPWSSSMALAPCCSPLIADPPLSTTQGAEVATMLLDEASRPTAVAAAPSSAAAPKRERDEAPAEDARGAAGGGPAKRAAAPTMSFGPGVAAAAARIIQEPAVAAAAAEQARRFRF